MPPLKCGILYATTEQQLMRWFLPVDKGIQEGSVLVRNSRIEGRVRHVGDSQALTVSLRRHRRADAPPGRTDGVSATRVHLFVCLLVTGHHKMGTV